MTLRLWLQGLFVSIKEWQVFCRQWHSACECEWQGMRKFVRRDGALQQENSLRAAGASMKYISLSIFFSSPKVYYRGGPREVLVSHEIFRSVKRYVMIVNLKTIILDGNKYAGVLCRSWGQDASFPISIGASTEDTPLTARLRPRKVWREV